MADMTPECSCQSIFVCIFLIIIQGSSVGELLLCQWGLKRGSGWEVNLEWQSSPAAHGRLPASQGRYQWLQATRRPRRRRDCSWTANWGRWDAEHLRGRQTSDGLAELPQGGCHCSVCSCLDDHCAAVAKTTSQVRCHLEKKERLPVAAVSWQC